MYRQLALGIIIAPVVDQTTDTSSLIDFLFKIHPIIPAVFLCGYLSLYFIYYLVEKEHVSDFDEID